MKRTYEVDVTAIALRTIKVRANSGSEALEEARRRVRTVSGPWTIDISSGGSDEHFYVSDDNGRWLGPDSQGEFPDEEEPDDDDDNA